MLLGTYILLLLITEFISFQQRAQYQDQLARKRYDDQLVQQVSYCNIGNKKIMLNELLIFIFYRMLQEILKMTLYCRCMAIIQ